MSKTLIPTDRIIHSVYYLRGQSVLLDSDLAKLYGVETKVLNQAVKRNIERFPKDFMFQLTPDEAEFLRSQFVTSKSLNQAEGSGDARGGRRYLGYAFTEHGALMAATVLRSERAVQVSIQIVRAFIQMRETLLSNEDLKRQVEDLESRFDGHDAQLNLIFETLKQLMSTPKSSNRKVGFRTE